MQRLNNNFTHCIERAIYRMRQQHGFSMIPAMMAVVAGSLLSLGAWTAAQGDIGLQNTDRWSKVAYAEAQSGVTDYVQHMAEDSGYWQYCDRPPGTTGSGLGQHAINDTDVGATDHPSRRWMPYFATNSADDNMTTAQYSIDLIPANGNASCKSSSNRSTTMVDQTTGTIRVRVTGRSGPQVPTTATIAPDPKAPNTYVSRSAASISKWRELRWKKRSIVLEFRRKGFLDYAYFTDKEGFDPALQGATQKSVCATYYARQIPTDNKSGRYWYNGATTDSGVKRAACTEIRFADGDAINGPFHTNDSVLLASDDGATFGRAGKKDVAEVFDATCSFRLDDGLNSGADHRIPTDVTNDTNNRSGNCPPKAPAAGSVGPVINGRLVIGDDAGFLPLPETNEDLKIYGDPTNTDPDYQGLTFYGTTKIVLKNGSIDVNNDNINGGATTNYDYPTSGVIYVANSSSSAICLSNPLNAYPGGMPTGCALAEVSGTYDTPLTITSEADIVVAGNITKNASSATAVLGLIGTNFVRVRHYPPDYTGGNSSPKKCSSTGQNLNGSGTRVNNIDAAILTLQHSFIVDQYDCGIGLGTLTINGVLAQEYRGTVGTGSGTTGYAKNYVYDSRYKYLTPPHFLVPTLSTWRVSRYREQVPACACGG